MEISYLPLSWNKYLNQIRALAEDILIKKHQINLIVAISRGGLTLGHILSDHLRIPIWTIAIQSYTDIQTQGEFKITGKLQTSIKNKHILLADDVADSGQTFVRALLYLKRSQPASITTLAVFYKPRSIFKPDLFAEKTTKWILFPYENTEMIKQISTRLLKEGKSILQIRTFLKSLKFKDAQIDFVYRYYLPKEV